jgi:hypothetical protein
LSFASFSGTTFCSGVPSSTNYGDYFTTYTANLTEGTPSALTVNYNNSSNPTLFCFDIFCGAWVDWNNDGTFDDATERIMTSKLGLVEQQLQQVLILHQLWLALLGCA